MAYTCYRELFNDIGIVWDGIKENSNFAQQKLHSIQENVQQSTLFKEEKERKQIMEEMIDVTNQLMEQSLDIAREELNSFDDNELLSITKRKQLFENGESNLC